MKRILYTPLPSEQAYPLPITNSKRVSLPPGKTTWWNRIEKSHGSPWITSGYGELHDAARSLIDAEPEQAAARRNRLFPLVSAYRAPGGGWRLAVNLSEFFGNTRGGYPQGR